MSVTCATCQRHKPRVPLSTQTLSDTLTTAWLGICLLSRGTTDYVRVTGKNREKPHTCVHGQHGLCLLDLGCQLVLPGPDIMKLGPRSLQTALSCGGETASVVRSSTPPTPGPQMK